MKRVKKLFIKISKIKKGKTVLLTLIPTNILLPLLPLFQSGIWGQF